MNIDKNPPTDSGQTNPINSPSESSDQKFVTRIWDTVNHILDKFLSKNPKEAELRQFMSDDSNLYDEDGKPTEAYKKHIQEMENYVMGRSVDEDIKDVLSHDELDEEMYSSVIEFVNRRQEVLRQFSNEEHSQKADFRPDKFIYNLVSSNTSTEEEKKKLLNAIENLAQEDALNALDDKQVSGMFNDIINKQTPSSNTDKK